MDVAQFSAFRDEFVKLSKTRYEKAIEAGELSRGDVTPGVPNLGVYRKTTRDMLHAPAEVAPEQLERTRAINAKRHVLQSQNAGHIVPGATGTLEPRPGMIAATAPTAMFENGKVESALVHAPVESGPLMRAVGGGFKDKALMQAAAMQSAQGKPFEHLLPAPAPVDATLNHAVGQHELGEAEHFTTGEGILPNASHAGVRPIVRENIAAMGDPEAVEHLSKARKFHADDALTQKYIRSVGGTPDSPIPIGGKQERAVERMLANKPKAISRQGRLKGLQFRDAGMHVPYVPNEVPNLAETGAGLQKVLKGGIGERFSAAKDSIKNLRGINKFLR